MPPPHLTPQQVDAYLARIGVARPGRADAAALVEIHRAHGANVPFENLDIHLGRPIVLDPERLVHKIVDQRRGGFCYELNGSLAVLLEALGFEVAHLEARVFADGQPGIRFDHLALLVDTGERWLVDVGFGAAFRDPLRFDSRDDQADRNGTFRLVDGDDGGIDVRRDGQPLYRVYPQPRGLADFEPGCRHHQSSPDSHFTAAPVCSLPTADGGRVTVRNRTMIVTAPDGSRTETELDPDEVRKLFAAQFGIDLEAVPTAARPLGSSPD